MVIPDHPRACGANNDATPLDMRDGGSSPRVRGKRHQQHGHKPGDRIIPARAGQTTHASYHAEPSTDHPRACGANRAFTCLCLLRFGSSPRVRGKRHMAGRPIWPVRIIPARAGQTRLKLHWAMPMPDHPRACGANPCTCVRALSMAGSSPRVRGKHRFCCFLFCRVRIIPARAGQTRER